MSFCCLAFKELLSADIVMKCGSQNRGRYIEIRKLSNAIGQDVCQALIGMHAFNGCDTVFIVPFWQRKRKALRTVQTDNSYRETFHQLGKKWAISEILLSNWKLSFVF